MAANALMIWRAFWSSNHPAAKFTREISREALVHTGLFVGAALIAFILIIAVH